MNQENTEIRLKRKSAPKSTTPVPDTVKKSKNWMFIVGALLLVLGIWFFYSKSSNTIAPNEAIAGEGSNSAKDNSNVTSTDVPQQTTIPPDNGTSGSDVSQSVTNTANHPDAENSSSSNATTPNNNATANNGGGEPSPVAKGSAPSKGISKDLTNNVPASFDKSSATLSNINNNVVTQILTYLSQNPKASISISGYASSEGNIDVNRLLSQRRADAFKALLISKGISSNRITATGKGIDNPIGSNDTDEGKTKNRRVEVSLQ